MPMFQVTDIETAKAIVEAYNACVGCKKCILDDNSLCGCLYQYWAAEDFLTAASDVCEASKAEELSE